MTTGLIVFACVFGGVLLGLYLSKKVAASVCSRSRGQLVVGSTRIESLRPVRFC
jgi:hypothetical protein